MTPGKNRYPAWETFADSETFANVHYTAEWSPDEASIAIAGGSKTFTYYKCDPNKLYDRWASKFGNDPLDICSIYIWNSDGSRFASAHSLRGHSSAVRSLSWSFCSNYLASCAHDAVRIWKRDGWHSIFVYDDSKNFAAVTFFPNQLLIAACSDALIHVFDISG